MAASVVLVAALLVLSALVVALGLVIIAARLVRRRYSTLRAARLAPLRPRLIRLLAAEEPAERSRGVADLLAMDDRSWRAVEPGVIDMLGKVRGSAHEALVELVSSRGLVDRALLRTRRRGAVGRARAAEMLGDLAEPCHADPLLPLLSDRDPDVRIVAARALGRCGDPAAAGPLLDCLREGVVPAQVVSQALLRLGGGAQEQLSSGLASDVDLVRAIAVQILGLTGAIGAACLVERCLTADESIDVRVNAAEALGRLGARSSLPFLLAASHAPHSRLRAAAAGGLGDLGDPGAVPRLSALVDDPTHAVASNAAGSLARLGASGLAMLDRLAARPQPGLAREHAREALAWIHLRAAPGRTRQSPPPSGSSAPVEGFDRGPLPDERVLAWT